MLKNFVLNAVRENFFLLKLYFSSESTHSFYGYTTFMASIYIKLLFFQKCLTTLDLTSLGVGSCVGTGMYLVAGMVAKNVAGPGVVVSFIIAAVASIFSGERMAA